MLVATLATASACITDPGFSCERDEQCSGLPGGACEADGFCSIEDDACPSGRRYADGSGAAAGACTLPEESELDADTSGPPDAGGGEPDARRGGGPGKQDARPSEDGGSEIVDFEPSNIPEELMTSATAPLVLERDDGIVEIDTDTGTIVRLVDGADLSPAGAGFTTIEQGDSQPALGVLSLSQLTIEDGVTLRTRGRAALVVAAAGDVTIAGVVDARGGRGLTSRAGPGGFRGGRDDACEGAGPGGGRAGSASADVGGGAGGHLEAGGGGGARSGNAGGSGGGAYGTRRLEPLVGGSGGGCGGGAAPRAAGGGGGGAVQISARGTIRVDETGILSVGGAGGAGGEAGGGGGGGSGGSILLEAGRIVVEGALAANGGGGGAGSAGQQPGSSGEAGKSSSTPARGGAAAGRGAAGGDGGAGETARGNAGQIAAPPSSHHAGGGGGAAGRLHLRADDIQRPGTVSPRSGLTESAL